MHKETLNDKYINSFMRITF